ncbi:MAG: hypothetical protein IIA63_10325, partial [Nitrospinae bacterium]|nr:hypothetical protein [Nitrospinota bacterium]
GGAVVAGAARSGGELSAVPTVPTCRVAAALLAALLLGACGDLPKPFAHQGPTDDALLQLEDSAGIVVAPPAGAPPHTGARLADAVTEALGAVNVPASVGGGNRQRRLSLRLGVNIVLYALTLDYKKDMVHLPIILERLRRVNPR